jgi:hypothetical protein
MLLALTLIAAAFAAPFLIDLYLRRLPIAPACPSCAAVARQAALQRLQVSVSPWIPAFGRTFVAECVRCGWKGRMRWKLAADAA